MAIYMKTNIIGVAIFIFKTIVPVGYNFIDMRKKNWFDCDGITENCHGWFFSKFISYFIIRNSPDH